MKDVSGRHGQNPRSDHSVRHDEARCRCRCPELAVPAAPIQQSANNPGPARSPRPPSAGTGGAT
jgi:hypothetical protein